MYRNHHYFSKYLYCLFFLQVNVPVDDMEPFHSVAHAQNILKGLDDFRKMDHLTDVTVCVRRRQFKCHKLILATSSPYFNAMFQSGLRESIENRVFIRNLDEKTVQTVIEYIYSGSVTISWDNVEEVLEAGNLFQVEALKDRCVQFLKRNLEPSNCIGVWRLGEKLNCGSLASVAKDMILSSFSQACGHEEFLSLDSSELVEILKDDELNAPNEEVVCDAVLRWLHKDDFRRKCLDDVLEHVRLPFVSPEYLLDTFENSITRPNDRCRVILEEAKRYHMLPARRQFVDSIRTKPRSSFDVEETVVFFCTKASASSPNPGNRPTNELKCFHLRSKEWTSLPTFPNHPNAEFAVCTHGSDIYVSGGTKNSTDFYQFNGTLLQWRCRAHMTEGRVRHSMAAVGDSLYAIGGYSATKILDGIEEYSIPQNKWTHAGRLAVGVCLTATAVCGQKIFVLGGVIDEQVSTAMIQCYDTRTKAVTTVGNLPFKCALHSSVACDQETYIVNRTGKLIKFCPGEKPMVVSHLDNFNRNYFGSVGYRGSVLVFGGRMGSSVQVDIHEYNMATGTWTVLPETIPDSVTINACVRVVLKKRSATVSTKL